MRNFHVDKHHFNPFVEHPCDGTDTYFPAISNVLKGKVQSKLH